MVHCNSLHILESWPMKSQRVCKLHDIVTTWMSWGQSQCAQAKNHVVLDLFIGCVFWHKRNDMSQLVQLCAALAQCRDRYVWIIMMIDCQTMYPALNPLLEQNNALIVTSCILINWPWISLTVSWTYVHESHNSM